MKPPRLLSTPTESRRVADCNVCTWRSDGDQNPAGAYRHSWVWRGGDAGASRRPSGEGTRRERPYRPPRGHPELHPADWPRLQRVSYYVPPAHAFWSTLQTQRLHAHGPAGGRGRRHGEALAQDRPHSTRLGDGHGVWDANQDGTTGDAEQQRRAPGSAELVPRGGDHASSRDVPAVHLQRAGRVVWDRQLRCPLC